MNIDASSQEYTVTFLDIIKALGRRKFFIFFLSCLFSVLFAFHAFTSSPVFLAEVTLSAPEFGETQSNQGVVLSGQGSALSSLVGLNLSSSNSSVESALAILNSRQFLITFINSNDIKKELYSGRWKEDSKSWTTPQKSMVLKIKDSVLETINPEELTLQRKLTGTSPEPSDLQAYKKFKDIIAVNKDKQTGMFVLSIEWTDPYKAAIWANDLVKSLNSHMRAQHIAEAQKSIQFLEDEITQTDLSSTKITLHGMVEQQLRRIMLANVREEYAFKVIDPAVTPNKRSKPNRVMIILFGFGFGFVLSALVVLIRDVINKNPEQA